VLGMAYLRASVLRILKQKVGNPRRGRFNRDIHCDGYDHSIHSERMGAIRRGFPAMTINTAFLMKDVVLLAVSLYLLKQDVMRTDFITSPK
jgi:hypothetical protein